jgi:DNA-directed RNA polymerase specialized sigma24 family protein
VLRYIGDLPESQIATLLGMTTGTVKTHIHRALRTLRMNMSDFSSESEGVDI